MNKDILEKKRIFYVVYNLNIFFDKLIFFCYMIKTL